MDKNTRKSAYDLRVFLSDNPHLTIMVSLVNQIDRLQL